MKIFDTSNLDIEVMKTLSPDEAAHIYNGLDVCVTAEIFSELSAQIEDDNDDVRLTYKAALSKLAPIMEMSLRGTKIDETARLQSIQQLGVDLNILDGFFQRIMVEVFGARLNWNSPTQVKGLFYTMLGLKEIKKRNTEGRFVATVGREALEQLTVYMVARPLANMILAMRDLQKQISFLKTALDKDNRIRTSYNLAGTNTGRLSSSMSDFGTGTNLQNVNRKLRFPFVADPGMYLLNIDLEQADGRNVGAICWNMFVEERGEKFAGAYLDACESGDLHTIVCNSAWPELAWPTDRKEWKFFCDNLILYGQDSYRQGAKKLGHGTNYLGTPRTMAKHTHTPRQIIELFQSRYFGRFPCIPAWHAKRIDEVTNFGAITTLFGRRRMFFGRGSEATTHRKAIAYEPQSMTGEQIDRGMLQIWRKFPQVELLNQVHDSILLQIPYSEITDLVPAILETMKVPLELKRGRMFTVPLDAAGGWNWGYRDKDGNNPSGLSKWKGEEKRLPPSTKNRLQDYL